MLLKIVLLIQSSCSYFACYCVNIISLAQTIMSYDLWLSVPVWKDCFYWTVTIVYPQYYNGNMHATSDRSVKFLITKFIMYYVCAGNYYRTGRLQYSAYNNIIYTFWLLTSHIKKRHGKKIKYLWLKYCRAVQ